MFNITPTGLRRLCSSLIFGSIVGTILASPDQVIFAEWGGPLREADISFDALNGAKAATLAILAAGSFTIGLIPASGDRISLTFPFVLRRSSFINICTAMATLGAGWFWLLDATIGNPVPFLIALVPSAGYGAVGYLVGSAIGKILHSDAEASFEWTVSTVLNEVWPYFVAVSIIAVIWFLPPYIFLEQPTIDYA